MTINYFGKQLNLSSQTKAVLVTKLKLVENDEVWHDDSKIVEEMNNFFKNAVSTLDIKENSFIINHDNSHVTDPVEI